MKDILQDIVAHTHSLGTLNMVKVTPSEDSTLIESITDDRTIILIANTHQKVDQFVEVFGMPDLNKLQYHLKNPEYAENAKITVETNVRNGIELPTHIHFENEKSDFQNDYRFMEKKIIEEKLKSVKFKVSEWEISFQPSVTSIQRLKLMSGNLGPDEKLFQVKTEDDNLNFYFGDLNTHAGKFTFQHNVEGSLKYSWFWNVDSVKGILDLDGEKTMSISDQGAMMISVDSGLAKYDYILPAHQK